ncbi:hypothetical protein Ddye_005341 [Dipteronia dyeriana]|uniref:DUF2062 domain-containing protein n=1 Tax=Dipteronia dyeriana TaxID=168575 RepID=A0AAD9XGX1_9ROSI|nr:hypothetical protein Ddye_005341 [Dipteronia dyeriana]
MILGPWFNKKVIDPVLEILKRGTEPKELAFSTALGFTLGLFPICGVPVFLCGMAIAVLKSNCHAASMMLANFVSTPVELSLVVPFLRFGETITGGSHFPLTSDALKKVLTGQASQEILISIGHALLGWLVAVPFIFAALYILLLPVFKILVLKFNSGPLSPKLPLNSLIDLKIKKYFPVESDVDIEALDRSDAVKVKVIHGCKKCFLASSTRTSVGLFLLQLY